MTLPEQTKYDDKLVIGTVVIVLFSVVVGFLNFGIVYLFGVPLIGLVVGLIVLWISKSRIIYRLIVTFSILPIVIASFFIWRTMNLARPEIFLLPDGFRGEFVIFFEEKCGVDEMRNGTDRVYEIPASGVLILNADRNRGLLNRRFFFVEEDGRRVEFPEFGRQKFETELEEWDWYGKRSSIEPTLTRQTVGAFWAYGSDTAVISNRSAGYIIADYDTWEALPKNNTGMRRDLANRAKVLMNECRERALN